MMIEHLSEMDDDDTMCSICYGNRSGVCECDNDDPEKDVDKGGNKIGDKGGNECGDGGARRNVDETPSEY